MIPSHQRDNHERTDFLIFELQALLVAIDELRSRPGKETDDAADALQRMAIAKSKELQRAHLIEWAGLGGDSMHLLPEEIALAMGQGGAA